MRNLAKTVLLFVCLAALAALFPACNNSPTAPQLPNSFKITDFQYVNEPGRTVGGQTIGTYTNNTASQATITGTLNWGDGASVNFTGSQVRPSASGNWAGDDGGGHLYTAKGTYHVEITATCQFSNGPITDNFAKDIVVDK